VVEAIAYALVDAGFFSEMHAPIVRPKGDKYEIIAGHQRVEGAKEAGIDQIPCWVQEMSDTKAYMLLVTSNNQGELTPLEIGLHALRAVPKAKGGKGQKGGLSEYSKRIGKNRQDVNLYRQAAEVYQEVKHEEYSSCLLKLAFHLSAIQKAHKSVWPTIVSALIKDDWTVAETKDIVADIRELAIPASWGSLFLPLEKVVAKMLSNKQFTSDKVAELVRLAESGTEMILSLCSIDEAPPFSQEWRDWLKLHAGSLSWLPHEVQKFKDELEIKIREMSASKPVVEKDECDRWIQKQDQCDLLLTDPPFSTDVKDIKTFCKWLPKALAKVKSTGRAYVFVGAYPEELRAYLSLNFGDMVLAQVLVWEYRNTLGPAPNGNYKLNWQAILYFRGPDAPDLNCPVMSEQFSVQDINAPDGRVGDRFHAWQKPDEIAERFIRHATKESDVVLDPFAGTGTFVLAANRLGRVGKGCEESDEMLEICKDRGCRIEN
jgi:ParB-like chromosome segregation protein Spo0J